MHFQHSVACRPFRRPEAFPSSRDALIAAFFDNQDKFMNAATADYNRSSPSPSPVELFLSPLPPHASKPSRHSQKRAQILEIFKAITKDVKDLAETDLDILRKVDFAEFVGDWKGKKRNLHHSPHTLPPL
jgi:hypothetical protein